MLKEFLSNNSKTKKPILFILLSVLGILAIGYWFHAGRYLSTDDSYVNANIVQIAPRVTGQVTHLFVDNNQFVRKGQVLLKLDSSPFIVAIQKAKAQLSIDLSQLQNAQVTDNRTTALVKKKILSAQSGDDVLAKLQSAEAAVQLSKANLIQAELDLQYTQIVAPTDGWISNMSLQVGNIVQANQPLFALISNSQFWVDANFKETELAKVKPGQVATIKTDMYPGHPFKGVVDSISHGSGTAFSLLPPQNATGNWVKVTQRVPVRVRVINPDQRFTLHIGTTATVTVDTKSYS